MNDDRHDDPEFEHGASGAPELAPPTDSASADPGAAAVHASLWPVWTDLVGPAPLPAIEVLTSSPDTSFQVKLFVLPPSPVEPDTEALVDAPDEETP